MIFVINYSFNVLEIASNYLIKNRFWRIFVDFLSNEIIYSDKYVINMITRYINVSRN